MPWKDLTKKREADRRRKAVLIAAGRCRDCTRPVNGKINLCESCAIKYRKRQRKRALEKVASGGCGTCGATAAVTYGSGDRWAYCMPCYLKTTAARRLGARRHWRALLDKLDAQGWRCAYTGETLVLGVNDSLDHIMAYSTHPELRHDPANVEWVTRQINTMKRDLSRDAFLALLRTILEYRR